MTMNACFQSAKQLASGQALAKVCGKILRACVCAGVLGNGTWLAFIPLAPVKTSSAGLLILAFLTVILSAICLLLLCHLLGFHFYLCESRSDVQVNLFTVFAQMLILVQYPWPHPLFLHYHHADWFNRSPLSLYVFWFCLLQI